VLLEVVENGRRSIFTETLPLLFLAPKPSPDEQIEDFLGMLQLLELKDILISLFSHDSDRTVLEEVTELMHYGDRV